MQLDFKQLPDKSPIQVNQRARQPLESAKAAVLLGLAVYFAYNILNGDLTNYINARFAWLSYIAVVLFGTLGLATLISIRRGDFNSTTSDHMLVSWPILLIVAIPLILGTLVPSRPLGAQAVSGDISVRAASYSGGGSVTKEPLERNVLDWVREFNQPGPASAFNGQAADVLGFVYTEPDFPDGHFMLARFTVSCCVADASAIGIPVYWEGASDLSDDQWVQVSGTFQADVFRGSDSPILQAESLERVPQPEHPYLYP